MKAQEEYDMYIMEMQQKGAMQQLSEEERCVRRKDFILVHDMMYCTIII